MHYFIYTYYRPMNWVHVSFLMNPIVFVLHLFCIRIIIATENCP